MGISKKFGGWTRLGIILSVVWFFVFFAASYKYILDNNSSALVADMNYCFSSSENYSKCMDKSSEEFLRNTNNSIRVLIFIGLLSIPLGWMTVWIIVLTVRWVKRGFT